ncbi:glucose sorbosone dehydrogenase [Nocardioides sp. Root1257]|uniref:PQQ-dependent sugar dehydrogenase n=1 Tax=unclassified Nocardioides TaxID=2615069 RepID=UPI0006F78770|nr:MULTISPECIES: PQQ-dependent sugar dehydrogenase [unclassified Nocardioides]KQW53731.1 glucose sorbosone dehydrogenase [Nocardioides sp. Root1257]KRC56417.1 glucose sorbosone dehydrogenase [Nocardioides sp. Root224]
MRRLVALASAAVLTAGGLTACSDGSDEPETKVVGSPSESATPSPTASPSDSPTRDTTPPKVVGTVATGLQAPWGIGFLPNGDAVVTERDTTKVLLLAAPSYDVKEVGSINEAVGLGDQGGEAGLLGVAVSPDFEQDHLLFFYYSTESENRIVKATLESGRLETPTTILDGIPRGFIHDGGRLAFGPDGYLYASTGETGSGELAQDKDTPAGKILRITTDGEAAPGNPVQGNPYWSYGHRNVQGLAFDDRDRLWASEFGQDTYDELNLITKGANYGWPMVEGKGSGDSSLEDPQEVWNTDEASPSGLAWLDGYLWMASLKGERLWRVDVTGKRAKDPTDFFVGEYGRMRTVAVAPDGNLWVTTSNTDGRGDPQDGDDRILLIEP